MEQIIKTSDEAKRIATVWAMDNKKDIISSIDYSTIWFEKTPSDYRNSIALKIQLELFLFRKTQECDNWKKAADQAWEKNSEWTLETVKHLAIINGAGLAGCSAILASNQILISANLPFILFAIGLFLAVADLYCCSIGHKNTGEKYNKLYQAVSNSKHEIHITQSINQTNLNTDRFFYLSSFLGWGSVFMAIAAGVIISIRLFK